MRPHWLRSWPPARLPLEIASVESDHPWIVSLYIAAFFGALFVPWAWNTYH